jgi:hydrogenase maturation protease
VRRVIVAGMGNVLRRDDGFGVQVARHLATSHTLPAQVRVIEVGIGGIHLVHELMARYDLLIIVDAVDRASAPGTVHVLQADVDDLGTWSPEARGDFLADMHYATPSKALVLARALGVLPPRVFIVGCQPENADELGIGLSAPVARSVHETVHTVQRLVARALGHATLERYGEENQSGATASGD